MNQDTRKLLEPYLGRSDLIDSFKAAPLGPYRDELLHLLTLLRGVEVEGKYALVETLPSREWVLATLSGRRGTGPTLLPEYKFHSLAEAEWTIFRLRWAFWTGVELAP